MKNKLKTSKNKLDFTNSAIVSARNHITNSIIIPKSLKDKVFIKNGTIYFKKTKPKYNGKIPKKVLCFSNGTMVCFDDYGNQIPVLQKKGLFELWFEWLETKGINPLEIETIKAIVNGRNVLVKPRKRKKRWSCEFILNED